MQTFANISFPDMTNLRPDFVLLQQTFSSVVIFTNSQVLCLLSFGITSDKIIGKV